MLSNSSMRIELHQCPGVHSKTGFMAKYEAIQHTAYRLIGNNHKILMTNDTASSVLVSPLYAGRQHSDLNTWHIVLEPYYQISFNGSCQQDCAMYDGPGDRSSKINALIGLTSGFHLFIRQKSSALLIKYKAFFNNEFPDQNYAYYVHTSTGNVFRKRQVSARESNMIRLKRLQTHSADILSEFSTYECLYGGIYIFTPKSNGKYINRHPEMTPVLRMCVTIPLLYFLYPFPFETVDQQFFIYIIFYTGYLDGSVAVNFLLQDCSVKTYEEAVANYKIQNACSKLILKLKPEEQMEFTMNDTSIQGPGFIRAFLVSLHYKLHMTYSLTITERDLFNTKSMHMEHFSQRGYYIKELKNPTEITVREQNPSSQFLSMRMFIMEYIKEIKCRGVRRHLLYEERLKSYIWVDLSGVLCRLASSNNLNMNVSYLVTVPTHFGLSMSYQNPSCKTACRHTNVTIREYSSKIDAFIIHSYTSLPLQWHNLLSRRSFEVTLSKPRDKQYICLDCSIHFYPAKEWSSALLPTIYNSSERNDPRISRQVFRPQK